MRTGRSLNCSQWLATSGPISALRQNKTGRSIMTVAILGQGNMGKGLAGRLAGKTDLALGAREPKSAELSYADAVAKADIVVLALPFGAAVEAAKSLNLAGKT